MLPDSHFTFLRQCTAPVETVLFLLPEPNDNANQGVYSQLTVLMSSTCEIKSNVYLTFNVPLFNSQFSTVVFYLDVRVLHLTLWHTPTAVIRAVRRSEPLIFAFSSSFLSVDGMTCRISF
jgi:hypothetical protein